jgi:cell division protein FtsA
MDTRIGYPNEHLAGDSDQEIASPTYATAVGLLMNSVENKHRNEKRKEEESAEASDEDFVLENVAETESQANTMGSQRRSVLDRWADRLKEFLDNAE